MRKNEAFELVFMLFVCVLRKIYLYLQRINEFVYFQLTTIYCMNTSIIIPQKDPMGTAILDYQKNGAAVKLRVLSSLFEEDSIDVPYLFRTPEQMPLLEQKALELARGRVLDVGAGAGCHTLPLQKRRLQVTAIDISTLSVQAMKLRGVRDARCVNLFDFRLEGPYDTILMLMNGTGVVGSLLNMSTFFARMRTLLAHGGQILIDSSDLRYLYEDEDGNVDIDPGDGYYGQVDYQMAYGSVKGDSFDWLYLDFRTLHMMAGANGFRCDLIMEGDHYDYLARLTLK